MEVDLVLTGRLQLVERREHILSSQQLGRISIIDAVEFYHQAVLEGTRPVDGLFGLGGTFTYQKTTAGREYRVRRVCQRLDHDLAANSLCIANESNDRQCIRRHATVRTLRLGS